MKLLALSLKLINYPKFNKNLVTSKSFDRLIAIPCQGFVHHKFDSKINLKVYL